MLARSHLSYRRIILSFVWLILSFRRGFFPKVANSWANFCVKRAQLKVMWLDLHESLQVSIFCSLSLYRLIGVRPHNRSTQSTQHSLHTTPHGSNHFKHEAVQRLIYHITDASRVRALSQRGNDRSHGVRWSPSFFHQERAAAAASGWRWVVGSQLCKCVQMFVRPVQQQHHDVCVLLSRMCMYFNLPPLCGMN